MATKKLGTLQDLYIEQLEDLYDAEQQLVEALPKMAKAAANSELRRAFTDHLQQTKGHVQRLQQVFDSLDKQPRRKTCQAMKGLIKEGSEMIEKEGDPDVKDAGLIAAAQHVEHYEMAAYGTVRTFAQILGSYESAQLLQTTLNEEGDADKLLTSIATTQINQNAAANR